MIPALAAGLAIAVSPVHIRDPALAVDAHGQTVAAWTRTGSHLDEAQARIGGRPARALGRGFDPAVAIGADGTAAVAMTVPGKGTAAAIARPGHDFVRPRIVAPTHV